MTLPAIRSTNVIDALDDLERKLDTLDRGLLARPNEFNAARA
jgi:hypothetical protein